MLLRLLLPLALGFNPQPEALCQSAAEREALLYNKCTIHDFSFAHSLIVIGGCVPEKAWQVQEMGVSGSRVNPAVQCCFMSIIIIMCVWAVGVWACGRRPPLPPSSGEREHFRVGRPFLEFTCII